MPKTTKKRVDPHVPFLYEMVISFFESARVTLDPVMQAIDGYRDVKTLEDGRPAPPDHIAQKLAQLPKGAIVHHIGACLSATTNLGLAYVHTFRLLGLIVEGRDPLPPRATKPHLAKLYDALPGSVQQELSDTYKQVHSHDFEMEVSTGPFTDADKQQWSGGDFRAQLADWQSRGVLQDSHRSVFERGRGTSIRLFIPLRSVLVLDRILAHQVAPRLGRAYKAMDEQMSSRTQNPQLQWDGAMICVSLPDKLGRIIEAKWNPAVTSVVRIRESGTEPWGPGFETPFNMCSFVDLKPDTEYEIQVTHKNDAGEGEAAITIMKTKPERE